MTTTTVELELDVPEGVEIHGCERHGEGHAFEVSWNWPSWCRCDKCDHEQSASIEFKQTTYVVRDLDVWGQPSFWVYRPPMHRCESCGHRQQLPCPFRRERAMYTHRFEEWVVRSLIGSTSEDVARRLAVSAEMIDHIVDIWASDHKPVDPNRKITDIGFDEISLKKRHKLYVTIMTDLTDPQRPQVLAVAKGKDRHAANQCLDCLSVEQRRQVRCHRTDMGKAYPAACKARLKNSHLVVDRFHVAKRLGELADALRKK